VNPNADRGQTTMSEHEAQVAAAARGDDDALAVLVRAYHDRVYRFGFEYAAMGTTRMTPFRTHLRSSRCVRT
jgi:DNA-binding GntR family transcriptional regulator